MVLNFLSPLQLYFLLFLNHLPKNPVIAISIISSGTSIFSNKFPASLFFDWMHLLHRSHSEGAIKAPTEVL
jgi:hypothetical protein